MKPDRNRLAPTLSIVLLAMNAVTVPASAEESPKPLTDPTRAAALTQKLGDNRTGGMYYEDGHLVVTVTDQAAAETVRDAGGTPKLVSRSAAELSSLHRELDRLGNIPNTAWGVEAKTNQVGVTIFDGVPPASRARIKKVAAAHPGAIRIDRIKSKLNFKATDLRGGNKMNSNSGHCSAGFNTKNSAGTIYTLTAGHCEERTGNTWYISHNSTKIGTQTAYNFGTGTEGICDGVSRACDWATIKANGPNINPLGMVRYGTDDYRQIDDSRFPMEREAIDRIGAFSQDTTGIITRNTTTVNIAGKTLYGMFESSVCALSGDSGGPALNGKTALGLLSGGTNETVCDSSSSGTYRNYFTKVERVLIQRGLQVY
ncbi:S1 family peptidase [Streptomyces jumonjinensis]|uniref:S1 family peptidase n=1 Tax=Streptomyces jumonjinensis TaxID=1945 RepID=A0A646K9Y1_STRJU|nr:S1 family peptidase [Streptomyces jumonjinensis]MQS99012.1 S1 family peptidase [Streptomyces jumonjinensis]